MLVVNDASVQGSIGRQCRWMCAATRRAWAVSWESKRSEVDEVEASEAGGDRPLPGWVGGFWSRDRGEARALGRDDSINAKTVAASALWDEEYKEKK